MAKLWPNLAINPDALKRAGYFERFGGLAMDIRRLNVLLAPYACSWPSGDSLDLALLLITPSEVAASVGATATAGVEPGLGPWTAIGIQLPSGVVVELIEYAERPRLAGTIARVDRDLVLPNVLDELLLVLELGFADLPWISKLITSNNAFQPTPSARLN
ncbi:MULTISPECIES: hypothetical protein [unclassified Duganella]|uniref:hypothetical protein n=1 Tax=unclassified Duganella TaxID=2636909 RepID=UPI0012E36759|nr:MULTISPECIES: hypothetical protein [unclassified Duganella]